MTTYAVKKKPTRLWAETPPVSLQGEPGGFYSCGCFSSSDSITVRNISRVMSVPQVFCMRLITLRSRAISNSLDCVIISIYSESLSTSGGLVGTAHPQHSGCHKNRLHAPPQQVDYNTEQFHGQIQFGLNTA